MLILSILQKNNFVQGLYFYSQKWYYITILMNGDEQMIEREKNPEYLNSFLDYSITILNKSPNAILSLTVISYLL